MTTTSKSSPDDTGSAAPRRASGASRRSPATASESLLHRLRRAPSRELVAMVDEHGSDFTIREVRQILLNPFVDGETMRALAMNRKLTTAYEVRVAIARHRRTPESVAMRFIAGLYWRDLAELTLDSRLRASVRRVAERYVLQRLSRLTLGEKVQLARRSVASVAAQLISEGHPRVADAGLDNPRLVEKALLDVMKQSTAPRLLDRVADHARWKARYEIRAALCRNPATPLRVVLAHLEGLRDDDLELVAANEEHAGFVRTLAEELMASRAAEVTIGLESKDSSIPRREHRSPNPRRILQRFDLDPTDRAGPPGSRSDDTAAHEETAHEEKARKEN